MREREGPPLRLFYSYSPIDERLRGELESHPKLLQRRGLIATWHERQIEAGQDRRQQIDENLEHADIILLLVSSDFLASDYCYEMEMMRALERNNAGEARVIPVILRDVEWKIAKFSGLQASAHVGGPRDEMAGQGFGLEGRGGGDREGGGGNPGNCASWTRTWGLADCSRLRPEPPIQPQHIWEEPSSEGKKGTSLISTVNERGRSLRDMHVNA